MNRRKHDPSGTAVSVIAFIILVIYFFGGGK